MFVSAIPPGPSGLEVFACGIESIARTAAPMTDAAERIAPEHRLRTSQDYATVKRDGRALKGRHCMLLAATVDGPTRVGFIASRKGVGGAVQRNRARRRLREIVRRRWPRVVAGHLLAFIAYRTAIRVAHPELVADVERLLVQAGALPGTAA